MTVLSLKTGAEVVAQRVFASRAMNLASLHVQGFGRWEGCVYRALTGQAPDDATDRMREDLLVPISQRCTGQASTGFLAAIDQALAVDGSDRPPSVWAWRSALEASVPVPARGQAQMVLEGEISCLLQ